MKRLLILAVGLLVVVGLGGTAVTFLLGPDDEPPRPEAEIAAEPEPEAAAPVEEHEAPPAVIRRLHHEPLRHTGGKVDLGPLRKAIMASAESVVGPDQVVDVLIAKIVKGR